MLISFFLFTGAASDLSSSFDQLALRPSTLSLPPLVPPSTPSTNGNVGELPLSPTPNNNYQKGISLG